MYRKILNDTLRFGEEVGPDARHLLTGLLTRDPNLRLGVNGAEEIKRHPFFSKHIDFNMLAAKKIQPPFKPSVVSSCYHCWIGGEAFTKRSASIRPARSIRAISIRYSDTAFILFYRTC